MDIHKLRAKAHHIPVDVRIGKAGITSGIIEEITIHLKKKKLVKIRMLRSFADLYDYSTLIDDLVNKTQSTLVQQTGNTLVLYRG